MHQNLLQITIMGSTSHSFIIEKLKPGTTYEVKIRAFNLAGMSPVSTLTRQSTDPSFQITANMNETRATFLNGSEKEAENKNEPLVETEVRKLGFTTPKYLVVSHFFTFWTDFSIPYYWRCLGRICHGHCCVLFRYLLCPFSNRFHSNSIFALQPFVTQ